MLYQVPSGSKSSGSGFATGFAARYALRFATIVVDPSPLTRSTPFDVWASPCEHPAPAVSAYRCPSTNASAAPPLARLPRAALVSLDGSPDATTVGEPPL